MPVVIDSSQIADFETFFTLFPKRAGTALSRAINDTVRRVLIPQAKEQMYREVAFRKGYLDDETASGGKRLEAKRFATPTDLIAIVRGRDRPTSLAQFQYGGVGLPERGKPVPVSGFMVKPGNRTQAQRAMLVRLRGGSEGNVGLAIRLRPGEPISRAYKPKQLFPNVYLLYGPSVDQVFQGVAADLKPVILESLEKQFYRQYELLGRDGTNG